MVSAQANIPGKWMDFLCDSKNKTTICFPDNYIKIHLDDLFNKAAPQLRSMPNCNHEEADTRIVVHVQHAL